MTTLEIVIIVLFAISAVVGATMAMRHFRNEAVPTVPLPITHLVLNVIAIVLVIVGLNSIHFEDTTGVAALVLLVLTALGGLYLLSRRAQNLPIPRNVIRIHVFLAVVSVVVLLVFLLRGTGVENAMPG